MSYKIIEKDITEVTADAIVFSANPNPVCGDGMDKAVYHAAGAELLLAARKKIGKIERGDAVETPAFRLHADYLIHTVGPIWIDGNNGEFEILRSCYKKSISLAISLGCKVIAVPLISTGVYGFPQYKVLQTATEVFEEILSQHEVDIILVVYERQDFELSPEEYEILDIVDRAYELEIVRKRRLRMEAKNSYILENKPAPKKAKSKVSLDDLLEQSEESFREKLFKLIDERGLTDSQVYRKVFMPKQTFGKIRTQANHRPSKSTVIFLCLALELDIDTAENLIQSAGYVLSKSSKSDLVVRHCIMNGNYTVCGINNLLQYYGLPDLSQIK